MSYLFYLFKFFGLRVSQCDGVSNFVIEKYDAVLKDALAESDKLKKTMAAKSRMASRV